MIIIFAKIVFLESQKNQSIKLIFLASYSIQNCKGISLD